MSPDNRIPMEHENDEVDDQFTDIDKEKLRKKINQMKLEISTY